jgi:hypothetical protein
LKRNSICAKFDRRDKEHAGPLGLVVGQRFLERVESVLSADEDVDGETITQLGQGVDAHVVTVTASADPDLVRTGRSLQLFDKMTDQASASTARAPAARTAAESVSTSYSP